MLVLWAHTSNYSEAQNYKAVVSESITVPARELGSSLQRFKLFKPETISKRRREQEQREEGPSVEEAFSAETTEPSLQQEPRDREEALVPVVTNDYQVQFDKEGRVVNSRKDAFLDPNEPVFRGCKIYKEQFTFWQLMGWFNAGTDDKISAPDLFGCVQLPLPEQCFGECPGQYDDETKSLLLALLQDEKRQTKPWPEPLKMCFSKPSEATSRVVFGSPMLDTSLGQVDAVLKVFRELKHRSSKASPEKAVRFNGSGHSVADSSGVRESTQFDAILPPEMPTAWVQCEKCRKWRRLAWHVEVESLPDNWECSGNTWDPESASCDVPQDYYDPDKESTLDHENIQEIVGIDVLHVGDWRDVYCTRNHVYYEGVVKKLRTQKGKQQALFHFKGWSAKFDEWIPSTSDRLYAHNFYTNSAARTAREQEHWQGLKLEELEVEQKKAVVAQRMTKPKISPLKKEKKSSKSSRLPSKVLSPKKRKSTGMDVPPTPISSSLDVEENADSRRGAKRRRRSDGEFSELYQLSTPLAIDPVSVAAASEQFSDCSGGTPVASSGSLMRD